MNKAALISGLKNLLHHAELQGASCALVVKDEKANTLLSYNPGLYLVPASTMKLIATATALQVLGPSSRFQTAINYTGAISAGKVTGNLVIKGAGDPTLGSHYFDETSPLQCFEKVFQLLKGHSVEQVNGDILIDNSWFLDPLAYQDWTLEDYPWYYGAIPQALNFIDNAIPVRQSGNKIVITDIAGIDKNILREEFEVFEQPGIDEIKATGSPACDKKSVFIDPALEPSKYKDEKLSLSGPAKVFTEGLRSYLNGKGIKINAQRTNGIADAQHELGIISSPPLLDIVKNTHFDSINLFAECIYLTLQKEFAQKNGSFNDYWKSAIGSSNFNATDGSGLSRKNYITAAFLADMLLHTQSSKSFDFSGTLPLLGAEGTVKNYCRGLQAKNKVRLKTGSMGRVRSFAGFVEGTEKLTFAMIFNNYQCSEGEVRALCDKMLKEFAMA